MLVGIPSLGVSSFDDYRGKKGRRRIERRGKRKNARGAAGIVSELVS